jgi:hypothetical protein
MVTVAISKLAVKRRVNVLMAIALVVTLAVSGLLIDQLVSNDRSATLNQVRIQSQATATTDAQISESQSFTKVDSGSEKLVKGVTVLSMSGQKARVSHVDDFNFGWTGVWSADCQDSASPSIFKVDFITILPSGTKSAVVVEKKVDSGGFISGTFDGVNASSGQLRVESTCDWSLSIVKVS